MLVLTFGLRLVVRSVAPGFLAVRVGDQARRRASVLRRRTVATYFLERSRRVWSLGACRFGIAILREAHLSALRAGSAAPRESDTGGMPGRGRVSMHPGCGPGHIQGASFLSPSDPSVNRDNPRGSQSLGAMVEELERPLSTGAWRADGLRNAQRASGTRGLSLWGSSAVHVEAVRRPTRTRSGYALQYPPHAWRRSDNSPVQLIVSGPTRPASSI
jgi:hypothetical protein